MRASLVAVVLIPGLSVACAQPLSPTEPTHRHLAPVAAPSAAIGVSMTTAAGDGVVAAVPFKGEFEARLTQSTPLDPPLLANLNEGAGHATQLGRFKLRIPHVVNTMTRVATGTYEFTAANGDTLLAAVHGASHADCPWRSSRCGRGNDHRVNGPLRWCGRKLHGRASLYCGYWTDHRFVHRHDLSRERE